MPTQKQQRKESVKWGEINREFDFCYSSGKQYGIHCKKCKKIFLVDAEQLKDGDGANQYIAAGDIFCPECRNLLSKGETIVPMQMANRPSVTANVTGGTTAQGVVIDEQVSAESMRAEMIFKKKRQEYENNGEKLSESMEAALFAQCVELQVLKAPASAVFPDLDEMVVHGQNGHYVVSGYVDAQNSYGAMIRNQYTYSVMKTGDMWKCTDVFVDSSTSIRQEMNETMKDVNASVTANSIIWWILGIIGTIIFILVEKAAWGL